ncbi:MAG: rod shape-determining protein [Candidatus Niyogibacteria bacterium]|nr:rod shape-determining protein [Candidatus Niyogibacteria bacterium]
MLGKLFGAFSRDTGIDLGTANILVYVHGAGIVINEPSVVALNQKTGQVVAIGNEAKKMMGRTPPHISIIRPLQEGVISDFEVTQEMLAYFIKKVHHPRAGFFARPRVVIGIPSGITEVERRAVRDVAKNAGASEAYLVEEPMAAAIGLRLPVEEPIGNMVMDIGGGTTDIAVISLGGIVSSLNLRLAGDRLNSDIVNYVRDEYKLLLGEKTAEELKISIGAAAKLDEAFDSIVRGRDLVTGLPREVRLTDGDIRVAISKTIRAIIAGVKDVVEDTPPELVADVVHRGVWMVGGGAQLRGLATLIEQEIKIPTRIAEDPVTAVVRGCGIIVENINDLRSMLVEHEEAVSPE